MVVSNFLAEHTRCKWAQTNPLLRAYHDEEWGVPVKDSRALWGMLVLEGFQAGLSWLTVLKRREGFLRAFAGLVPEQVACFTQQDVERLMLDPDIIRSRAKIEAAIGNARAYLAMEQQGENFAEFVWGMVPNAPILNTTGQVLAQSPDSVALSKALKKRGFKFVGPVIVYAWMQAVGMVDDHDPSCFRYNCGA
ncbi:MAG: DNA-3-methyladenine glycosylase I [Acetobacter orientalis]|uniref:DNA-3-methyladenine glycosylase I n=1 Tax=Acetobacter orientalis TaxID=146474 RepID=UPI0039EB6F68